LHDGKNGGVASVVHDLSARVVETRTLMSSIPRTVYRCRHVRDRVRTA
jgi:hypothetical protein